MVWSFPLAPHIGIRTVSDGEFSISDFQINTVITPGAQYTTLTGMEPAAFFRCFLQAWRYSGLYVFAHVLTASEERTVLSK